MRSPLTRLFKKRTLPAAALNAAVCFVLVLAVILSGPTPKAVLSTFAQNDWSGGAGTGQDQYSEKTSAVTSTPGQVTADSANPDPTAWCNTATCNSSWKHRRQITLTNPNAQRTDYAVRVSVPYKGSMMSDYADLRFTNQAGNQDLVYYISHRVAGEQAYVWVLMPVLPTGATTMYVYYGMPGATTTSNLTGTVLWAGNLDSGSTLDHNYWSGDLETIVDGELRAINHDHFAGMTIDGAQNEYSFQTDFRLASENCYGGEPLGGIIWPATNDGRQTIVPTSIQCSQGTYQFKLTEGDGNNTYISSHVFHVGDLVTLRIVSRLSGGWDFYYSTDKGVTFQQFDAYTRSAVIAAGGYVGSGVYGGDGYVSNMTMTLAGPDIGSSFAPEQGSNWCNTANCDSSWPMRTEYTVKNSGGNLTNYQVKVKFRATYDVKDFSDLRFTDESGTQNLHYWVEKSDNDPTNPEATIWVKIPVLRSGATGIYLYHNKTGVTSQSDPDGTMMMTDKFSTGTLDTSRWTSDGSENINAGDATASLPGTNSANYLHYDVIEDRTMDVAQDMDISISSSNLNCNAGSDCRLGLIASGDSTVVYFNYHATNNANDNYFFISGADDGGVPYAAYTAANSPLRFQSSQSIRFRLVSYAAGGSDYFYSQDGGKTWTKLANGNRNTNNLQEVYFSTSNWSHNESLTLRDVAVHQYSTNTSESVVGIPEVSDGYSATLTSRVIDAGDKQVLGTVHYSTTGNGYGTVKVRTSSNADMSGAEDFSICQALSDGAATFVADTSLPACVNHNQRYVQYQMVLHSTSDNSLAFNSVTIDYINDNIAPSDPGNLTIKQSSSGAVIPEGSDGYSSRPYFSWDASVDADTPAGWGSITAGYCQYFGSDSNADPLNTSGLIPEGGHNLNTDNLCHNGTDRTNEDLTTFSLNAPLTADTTYYYKIRAIDSWGNAGPVISTNYVYRLDTTPPSNVSNITVKNNPNGSTVASGEWTYSDQPYFSWDASTDGETSVAGYCLYLGTDETADLTTTSGVLKSYNFGNDYRGVDVGGACQYATYQPYLDTAISSTMLQSTLANNTAYHLIVKAIDSNGNIASGSETDFKVDTGKPFAFTQYNAPNAVNTTKYHVSWIWAPIVQYGDNESGFRGFKYCVTNLAIGVQGCDINNPNDTNFYGLNHTSGSIHDTSDYIPITDGGFTLTDADASRMDNGAAGPGVNFVVIAAIDNAGTADTVVYPGNMVTVVTQSSASAPENLQVTPTSNTSNAFAFTWQQPSVSFGSTSELDYCWTVNVAIAQNGANCNWTGKGIYALAQGAYATQQGANTLYLATKDTTGNFDANQSTSVNFTATTTAPGPPRDIDSSDVSIRATASWKLAFTWSPPTLTGSGIERYKLYRSTDNTNFTEVGSTSSSNTSFIDSGLSQVPYYYYVTACDNAGACGAASSTVTRRPTGRYTSPARLTADTDQPRIKDIGTKKGTVYWFTDRESDSKVAYGTVSGQYSPEEVSNSQQTSNHSVKLNNLQPNTTYYYISKWTDVDGNTGTSVEHSFTTSPAPVIGEVSPNNISISSTDISFRSKDAAKVNVYFGKNSPSGGLQSINTSLKDSSYSIKLSDLDDGTKYIVKINGVDSDGNEYKGNEYSFTTLPRPKISNLRFQPVEGEPSSTQKITWNTNVASTSGLSFGPRGKTQLEQLDSKMTTDHQMVIKDLEDDSDYTLVARSADVVGNKAISDTQTFKTAQDTRPPKVSSVSVEASIRGSGTEASGQVVVSWKTDEKSTSQVAFGQGQSGELTSQTAEDNRLTQDHTVVVSNLPTSAIYRVQAVSRDKAGNTGMGDTQTLIIGRGSDNIFTIVFTALQKIFGIGG